MFWTVVLGSLGSAMGGAMTHMFSRPRNDRYPAGLMFSTVGASLILYVCFRLRIPFPQV